MARTWVSLHTISLIGSAQQAKYASQNGAMVSPQNFANWASAEGAPPAPDPLELLAPAPPAFPQAATMAAVRVMRTTDERNEQGCLMDPP